MFNLDYYNGNRNLEIILQNFSNLPKEIQEKHSLFEEKVISLQSMISVSAIGLCYFCGALLLLMLIGGPSYLCGKINGQEISKHIWINLTGAIISAVGHFIYVQRAAKQYKAISDEMGKICRESRALLESHSKLKEKYE